MTTSFTWPDGSPLAVSIVVNVEEGAEMTIADGDPRPEPVDEMGITLRDPVRNWGNESNYAYGINEGLGRITALLDEAGIPVTWTAAALSLARSESVASALRPRLQDEVASHGLRWVHQYKMGEPEETSFIRQSADVIEQVIGRRPVGYLSRYLSTDHTRSILVREGFRYSMDDYSRDEPFWASVADGDIVVVPYAIDTNDMKLWLHPSFTPRMWSDYADATLGRLAAEGRDRPRMMSLGLHLRIIGRPGRFVELERLIEKWTQRTDLWFATRAQIADHFAGSVAAPS